MVTWMVVDLAAQMEPDAPVIDFLLPRFGETGNRIWDLSGRKGIYISPEQIDVEGMRLRVFQDDNPDEMELQIESPRASIFIQENRAAGENSILVLGPTFSMSGTEWTWDGNEKKIVIRANCRVAFAEVLTDILR